MTVRAWRIWGVSAVLAGGVVAADPPVTSIEGRATPAITQDFYQPETAPPPRLLPQQVLHPLGGPDQPTAGGVETASYSTPPRTLSVAESIADRKGRMALQVADMFFDACELSDARTWYQEVIRVAPGTKWATSASLKLGQMTVIPAGESTEPPLADAIRIPQ